MNAATRTTDLSTHPESPEDLHRQAVSALVDGELSPAELDAVLHREPNPASLDADWSTFHLIGDVLRSAEPVASSRLSADFASLVCQRIRGEAVLRPAAPAQTATPVRGPAANDAVFRWKLVAGLASMAAVAAVGWTLLSAVSPYGASQTPLALAGSPAAPAAPAAPATAQESLSAVVVQTPQGQVVRDLRLEQLLAEHRQFGAMSALQTPAGFLRNATYDAAPSR